MSEAQPMRAPVARAQNITSISLLERCAHDFSNAASQGGSDIGDRQHSVAREADLQLLPRSNTGSRRSRTTNSWTNRLASSTASKSSWGVRSLPLQEGYPLESDLTLSDASLSSQKHAMSRHASQSSFSRQYDAIAGEIEESLQTVPLTIHHPPQDYHHNGPQHMVHDVPDRPHSTDTFQEAQIAFKDFDGVHFSPDTEEFVEIDQDGHEVRRISARTSSGSLLDAASLMRTPRASHMSYGAPPPDAGMVYYPAPVPKMLNLPKRLSKLPAAHAQAQRRSQMLQNMPAGTRESAPWIPPMTFSDDGQQSVRSREVHRVQSREAVRSQHSGSGSGSGFQTEQAQNRRSMLNQRMSMANINSLPPQLRASMYFEHQSVPHDVDIKSESAVATLDSILAASATAPVNAFTDHPYAGDVRKSVYAPERAHHRKNTSTALDLMSSKEDDAEKKRKKRSSSIGKLFRRNSTDLEGETKQETKSRPVSRSSTLDFNEHGKKLKKRQSQMSLGNDLERAESSGALQAELTPEQRRQSGLIDQAINASPVEERMPSVARPVAAVSAPLTEAQQIDQDFREQEEQDGLELEDDDDQVFAQPSTLLAELQVRKAQLKSRNRTAATAFPGGMHSTLLQLDAVEQINAKKRQKQRVALAWEDPELRARELAQQDAEDEDVPLGVLYPSKDGVTNKKLGDSRDWNRPLGLMERRELEDNEPLSSRRTRLNPGPPSKKQIIPTFSQVHLAGQPDMPPENEPDDEHADETLGQRVRRLKTKDALDAAISDVAPKDGARPISTFSASVLDEFPELVIKDKEDKRDSRESRKSQVQAPVADEEETLGQRRARLQREREASGEATTAGAARPALRQSASFANLLATNPIGQRSMSKNQQAAAGTLLHSASQHQLKQKQDLASTNLRSASYMLDKPLVDSRPRLDRNASSGLLAEQRSRPANGAFGGASYNIADTNAVAATGPQQSRRDQAGGLLGNQRSRPANGAFTNSMYISQPLGMQTSPSMPMFGVPNYNNVQFASPTAAIGYGYSQPNLMGLYQMPAMQQQQQQQQQQMMMNAPAYAALSGGQLPMMGMPTGGYNPMAGMSMGTYAAGLQNQVGLDQASQDPNQRAAIDRWRMGVAQ